MLPPSEQGGTCPVGVSPVSGASVKCRLPARGACPSAFPSLLTLPVESVECALLRRPLLPTAVLLPAPPLPRRRYVDYPITDVLQMMGRAGRPQYDRHGVAVIMVSFLAFRLSAT